MHRRFILGPLTALSVVALVAMWALMAPRPAAADDLASLNQPVSAELMARLERVSEHDLTSTPQLKTVAIKPIQGGAAPSTGLPLVLYMGADFCPYCAALRWPLALALMRFGDLSGLRYMLSSGSDVYPDTATFTFLDTRLESDLIDFQATELEDRDKKKLQKPDARAGDIFERFDKKPYTNYAGSIPFLYLDGRYVEVGSPFSPDSLKGMDWKQITAQLESGHGKAWEDIIGEANQLTAAVCILTQGKPDEVCTAPGIAAAAAGLAQ
ncbi:MAG: DUF929 family protein [Arenicellales bacterium]